MRSGQALFKVIAATVVLAGLSFLFVLDVRNFSRDRNSAVGPGEMGAYYDEPSLRPSQQDKAPPDLTGSVTGSLVDEHDTAIGGV